MLLVLAAIPGPAVADPASPAAAEFREPESSAEQQRTVTIAIYLLIALTVGTVSLLIILMLWGARVRRQVRKPLPTSSPKDPLWYLKTKKPPAKVSDGKDQTENGSEESTSG